MPDGIRRIVALSVLLLGTGLLWVAGRSNNDAENAKSDQDATLAANRERSASNDPRLKGAYRYEQGGWVYVHLEGDPTSLGFQHGFLLAPEISDAFLAISTNMTHSTKRDWTFFRQTAREMLWPKIDAEYQQELQGIAEGLNARTGSNLDVYDIVAMNAFEELPDYYVPWLNKREKAANPPNLKSPGNCSAFVATGSWTKDGKIVIAHNNWTNYMNGEGLMVTETTISQFEGWDPNGKAEFARARKALQYAGSIDEYTKIMLDGNNGGYANDWLLGDRKTGEIAQ